MMQSSSLPPAGPEAARDLIAATRTDAQGAAGLLLALLDRLALPLATKDVAGGRYVHVNAAMDELLGGGVAGLTDAELFGAAQAAALRTADQAALAAGGLQAEHRLERSGARREFSVVRVPVPAGTDAPALLLTAWQDLGATRQREQQLRTALEQLEAQQKANEALRRELHDNGLRDRATGLYSHAHFEDQLRREVDLSSREHRQFALVSIALDPLNEAAQAAGAAARTRILEMLGRQLRDNTRAMDASCRLDDDHFAVLLSGVGLATAHSRMEGLRRQCATQIVAHEGSDLSFTVSMGVASFPHTAGTQHELVQAADQALAEARRRGGNHVALASIRFQSRNGD
jgi:diguanylate cyclase (GGDEF)-like protein